MEEESDQFRLSDGQDDSMSDLLEESERRLQSLRPGQIIEGYVVRVDPEEVLVDVGLKSEGIISGRELGAPEEVQNLHVGDKILVAVVHPEDAEGHVVLSLRRAQAESSWRRAEALFQAGEIVEAPVVDSNRGGLIVDLGVRAFVPISQISDLRREETPVPAAGEAGSPDEATLQKLQAMLGRTISVKIIELNRPRNRLIASERAATQEQRGKRKEALLNELRAGDVRRGRVTSLATFGAFVDLGGADGLIHVSELSWTRVGHPSEVVNVGDDIDVKVINIDPETKKIALSLKQAQEDPWTQLVSRLQVGQIVPATITRITKFGAFARLAGGIEGLIHISELADRHISNPAQVVQEGENVQVKVTSIDVARRRLGLSLRQAMDEIMSGHIEGSRETEAGGDRDILGQEAQPPPNEELQKLAALRFEDETVGL
ncbi:MAG: S1 RNA-binding domain-containing protein [Chloroflexi bacterium]|nr:S1 RNA-binding domain-containing protein [Chloroflexota bacterium]